MVALLERRRTRTPAPTGDAAVALLYARIKGAAALPKLPVMTRDRMVPRKDQARLARELFKRLGLRGISVTAPNYSMAHSVDVRVPSYSDAAHDMDLWPHDHTHCCYGPDASGQHREEDRCPACAANGRARDGVGTILLRAFPEHDDRSDSQSDYFSFCWSIG